MASYPTANKTDVLMGRVMRDARLSKGITQKELADEVRVSFQQIQKYEAGANRISISRLFELSKAMGFKASDLIIAVETISVVEGQLTEKATGLVGLTEREIGLRALRPQNMIDDKLILDTVTQLLQLFNRRHALVEHQKPPLNKKD